MYADDVQVLLLMFATAVCCWYAHGPSMHIHRPCAYQQHTAVANISSNTCTSSAYIYRSHQQHDVHVSAPSLECSFRCSWYGMVWYGMVWYGMVWYGMVWYGMVWYGMQADQKLLKKGELGGEVRGHEGSLRGFQGSILLPRPLIALNVICQASQRRALLGLAYLHKAHQVLPPLQRKTSHSLLRDVTASATSWYLDHCLFDHFAQECLQHSQLALPRVAFQA